VKKSYLALILLAAIVQVLFTGPVLVANGQEAKELCLFEYKWGDITIWLRSDRRIFIPGVYRLEDEGRYSATGYSFSGKADKYHFSYHDFVVIEKGKKKIFNAVFTWEEKEPDKVVITYTGLDINDGKAKKYTKGQQVTVKVLKHSEFLIINGKKYKLFLVSPDASISKGKFDNNLKPCPNQPKGGQVFP